MTGKGRAVAENRNAQKRGISCDGSSFLSISIIITRMDFN